MYGTAEGETKGRTRENKLEAERSLEGAEGEDEGRVLKERRGKKTRAKRCIDEEKNKRKTKVETSEGNGEEKREESRV